VSVESREKGKVGPQIIQTFVEALKDEVSKRI